MHTVKGARAYNYHSCFRRIIILWHTRVFYSQLLPFFLFEPITCHLNNRLFSSDIIMRSSPPHIHSHWHHIPSDETFQASSECRRAGWWILSHRVSYLYSFALTFRRREGQFWSRWRCHRRLLQTARARGLIIMQAASRYRWSLHSHTLDVEI